MLLCDQRQEVDPILTVTCGSARISAAMSHMSSRITSWTYQEGHLPAQGARLQAEPPSSPGRNPQTTRWWCRHCICVMQLAKLDANFATAKQGRLCMQGHLCAGRTPQLRSARRRQCSSVGCDMTPWTAKGAVTPLFVASMNVPEILRLFSSLLKHRLGGFATLHALAQSCAVSG